MPNLFSKPINAVLPAMVVFALVGLPNLVACTPTQKPDRAEVVPQFGGEGTSTNVGSGGLGAKATWDKVSGELTSELRRLVVPPAIDRATFKRIKSELPQLVRTTRVEFVDYPLILGKETCDNRSDATFSDSYNSCYLVNSENNTRAERDAINFASCGLIKVSRPRFGCYDEASDRIKRLVLHEYLGMMGITETDAQGQTNYQITNALIEAFKGIAKFESGLRVELVRTCADFKRTTFEYQSHQVNGHDFDTRLAYPFIIWRLASDLDCSQFPMPADGRGYSILRGHLDGDGHTLIPPRLPKDDISAIRRDQSGEYERYGQALYEMVCARCVIANLHIKNADIYGTALLAANNYGTITNTSVEGTLKVWPRTQSFSPSSAKHTYVGGLVTNNEGFISNVEVDIKINDREYDYSVLDEEFSVYLGGVVSTNRGMITDVESRTKIEVNRSQIGGFINQNFGPIKNVNAYVDIRTNNPGRYIGGFAPHVQNVENIKISGWIRFPTLSLPYSSQFIEPDGSGYLALVGGYLAFGSPAAAGNAEVNVNICGNISIEQSVQYPSYTLVRNVGVANLLTHSDKSEPRFRATGRIFDRCPENGD